MKTMFKPAMAAALAAAALATPVMSTPAMAQAAERIGVVNLPAVIANSSAYQTAQTQRQTTYSAQIQQAQQREAALNAQLQPLVQAFNTARQQPNADNGALQQQLAQLQQLRQSGSEELSTILAPVALSQAYVEEQIQAQLGAAIENAARRQGVTMVLSPEVVLHAEASHNLNEAVLAELNALIPAAQLVPPAGWLPRELREQAAAVSGQQPQQPAQSGR